MTQTPDKARKAQQRARDRALGLVEVTVKVRREDAPKVRKYAAQLTEARTEA